MSGPAKVRAVQRLFPLYFVLLLFFINVIVMINFTQTLLYTIMISLNNLTK